MKQLLSLMARAGAVAVCMLTAGHVWAGAPAVMAAHAGQTWIAASDSTLAKMRGGFDFGGGLSVSFGFMSSVAINGSQVVNSTFNIPNLSAITPQLASTISQQLGVKLVQNGPGNTAGVTASPGSSHTDSVTVNTGGGAASQVTTATNTPSVSILPTNAAALGTIVQNTMSNQTIQTNTVINIGTNGLSIWKGMNLLNALNSALANMVR
ncbi:MAG: hypothetical protein OJF60_003344 [Burkholderiaceae bacterium]|jgi:hypothetical protein|nr:MAG: hypothetical protein OJF60_003344 [Burkholderiaceae bacterium]